MRGRRRWALLVVLLAVLALAGCDGDRSGASPPAAGTPSSSAPPPTSSPAERPLPPLVPDDQRWVREGREVTLNAELGILDGRELRINYEGYISRLILPDRGGGPGELWKDDLQFDLAATSQGWPRLGYLVRHMVRGRHVLDVVLRTSGGLLLAELPASPPVGESAPGARPVVRTWTTEGGSWLLTRVSVGDPAEGRFRLYSWRPVFDAASAELVPESLGVVCRASGGYDRC